MATNSRSADRRVNAINNNGETPLILAVHRRDIDAVHLLVDGGADPKIQDTLAGKSALDYARQDSRLGPILKVMEDAKAPPKKAVSGPVLGF